VLGRGVQVIFGEAYSGAGRGEQGSMRSRVPVGHVLPCCASTRGGNNCRGGQDSYGNSGRVGRGLDWDSGEVHAG